MIELQTGKITFPELNITVSPLLHYADFISDFPKNKITQIRDMRNGYIWYDIKEKVYDNKIPVYFCGTVLCHSSSQPSFTHKIPYLLYHIFSLVYK